MPEKSSPPLPRRRFGQSLLAAALALLALGRKRKCHRFEGHRFETGGPNHSLREADFYEIERPLP